MLLPDAMNLDLDAALRHFSQHGYARLGRVVDDEGLALMRRRVDDLMHGRRVYPGMFFQRDSATGSYDDLTFGRGYEGPGSHYRKVEKLELDEEFRRWIRNPLFEKIARRLIEGDIALYRAVVFNKADTGGTRLPWHQDGGKFWGIDRDPTLQIWTALDDVPVEAGCVELIPGTHEKGLRTPFGGSIPDEIAGEIVGERLAHGGAPPLFLPAVAGECLLIHNHVWHRSGINQSGHPRRALSFCYMSGKTRCRRKKHAPRTFFQVWGPPTNSP